MKFAFPNREIICLNGAITVRLSWLVILEVIDSCKLTLTESSTSFDQVIWALSGMLTYQAKSVAGKIEPHSKTIELCFSALACCLFQLFLTEFFCTICFEYFSYFRFYNQTENSSISKITNKVRP